MSTGLPRRDEAQDNLAGRADMQPVLLDGPGLVTPAPISAPDTSFQTQVAQQLTQWGGKKFAEAVNKKQQRDTMDGQMAFQQGKAYDSLTTAGNKFALEGYRLMDAQTVASSLMAAQRDQIETTDFQLDEEQFRKQYVSRLEAATAGLDKDTSRLVQEQMLAQMPTLVADHTSRRAEWQENENFSSLERGIDVISRDPTGTPALVLFARGGEDSPSAGLSDARRQAAVVSGVVRAFDNDNPLAYAALSKEGLIGDNLTSAEQNEVKAAQERFENRRRTEYNQELISAESALMHRVELGELDPSAAAEELSVLYADHGIKMTAAEGGAMYASAEAGQNNARITRGMMIEEATLRGDTDRAADIVIDSLTGTESGGNAAAFRTNNDGRSFGGLLQFGQERLNEVTDGLGKGRITVEQFASMSATDQRAINRAHVKDLIQQAQATGAIGSTINGVTVTLSGLVAVAHLGGAAGMRKFVQSGGQYNPADQLGTSLTDYLSKHGSGEMHEFMSPEARMDAAHNQLNSTRERLALDTYEKIAPQLSELDGMFTSGRMSKDDWQSRRTALYNEYRVERTKADVNHEIATTEKASEVIDERISSAEDEAYKLNLESAKARVFAAEAVWKQGLAVATTPEQIASANDAFVKARDSILTDAGIKPIDRGDGAAAQTVITRTMEATDRGNAARVERAEIDAAAAYGYLGDMSVKQQMVAFDDNTAKLNQKYSDMIASKQVTPAEAEALFAQDMNMFYANAGVVAPKVRSRSSPFVMGTLLDAEGNPNPLIVDTVRQYAELKELNPRAAETMFSTEAMLRAEAVIARGGAPGLIAEGVRNLGMDESSRSPLAQPVNEYMARRDVQEVIDRTAAEYLDSEDIGFFEAMFNSTTTVAQSQDRRASDVDRLWSGEVRGQLNSVLADEVGRLHSIAPNLKPSDVVAKAFQNVQARTTIVGGDTIIGPAGADFSKDFFGSRAQEFSHPGAINSAIQMYLRSPEATEQYGNLTESTAAEMMPAWLQWTADKAVGLAGFNFEPAMSMSESMETGTTGVRPTRFWLSPQGKIVAQVLLPTGNYSEEIVIPAEVAGKMYMKARTADMLE